MRATVNWFAILHYINLYLVVTSRIADLVPTVASSWICLAGLPVS